MLSGAKRLAFAFSLLCCGAAAAQVSGNQAGFVASGQTGTLDCAGGKAEIMGSNNTLTISGNCAGLDMYGSGNKLTVQFKPGAQISFVGSGNAISWTSADGKPPRVSYVGSGNTLTPPILGQ
jgi:hypothetical protein